LIDSSLIRQLDDGQTRQIARLGCGTSRLDDALFGGRNFDNHNHNNDNITNITMKTARDSTEPNNITPTHRCDICTLDLQSQACLEQHLQGRKHCKRSFAAGRRSSPYPDAHQQTQELYLPGLYKEEFVDNLQSGCYRNIVALTGAGVSTSAGVPDYRSCRGMFEMFQKEFAGKHPELNLPSSPEVLFSRDFANQYSDIFHDEILPSIQQLFIDLQPTPTHRFCAYLAQKGWLKRLYTQNEDGLHTHASLKMNEELVVECHGSMRRGDLVLYGDPLPQRFFDLVSTDFDQNADQRVDLVLVFGTSLRVAPFCGVPNLAPKYCHRVLVNRNLADCLVDHTPRNSPQDGVNEMSIGSHKAVSLSPLLVRQGEGSKETLATVVVV
jgi:NAD-dependent deacetylase sirtuin 2